MSLTADDLMQIEWIGQKNVKPLNNEIMALRNDVKDIYDSIEDLRKTIMPDKDFQKLNPKEQILQINRDLEFTAKHLGVKLPR